MAGTEFCCWGLGLPRCVFSSPKGQCRPSPAQPPAELHCPAALAVFAWAFCSHTGKPSKWKFNEGAQKLQLKVQKLCGVSQTGTRLLSRAGKIILSCLSLRVGSRSGAGKSEGRGLKNWVTDLGSLWCWREPGGWECSPALGATCTCPLHLDEELSLIIRWEQSVPH